jgi:hypothetical protein
MNRLRLTGLSGLAALAVLCVSPASSQTAGVLRDGQHDFVTEVPGVFACRTFPTAV